MTLNILDIQSSDTEVDVEVDDYVPLNVITYRTPIGAVFYRVGNFSTSLVEIPIDPDTGLLRGFTIVSMDRMGAGIADSSISTATGLPRMAMEDLPDRIVDATEDVVVNLSGDRFVATWCEGRPIDRVIRHRRLEFYTSAGRLVGVGARGLSAVEVEMLNAHLARLP